jgi:hypothetical protein
MISRQVRQKDKNKDVKLASGYGTFNMPTSYAPAGSTPPFGINIYA